MSVSTVSVSLDTFQSIFPNPEFLIVDFGGDTRVIPADMVWVHIAMALPQKEWPHID